MRPQVLPQTKTRRHTSTLLQYMEPAGPFQKETSSGFHSSWQGHTQPIFPPEQDRACELSGFCTLTCLWVNDPFFRHAVLHSIVFRGFAREPGMDKGYTLLSHPFRAQAPPSSRDPSDPCTGVLLAACSALRRALASCLVQRWQWLHLSPLRHPSTFKAYKQGTHRPEA